eukprot:CAMPEP_0170309032 /NCGR_PEP_ID=MMETSP0116_2-20130129/54969_1 /TAXON_ID=400756 /ORGANISM="Durinskia baltica, Strain CSIRO CS-38" /LENGTH=147 /DNA_ID=CAMNT_0010561241 /DNA_START=61 /DNA_END=500 /DNA_ORIENTATION=-
MSGVRVEVRHASKVHELEFPDGSATIGDLREAVERQMSVPRAAQKFLCGGRQWQGIAFADDLRLLEAAGPRGTKEMMGVQVITVMLMAPADADGSQAVSKIEGQVQEASDIMAAVAADAPAEEARKRLLLVDDLLSRAATGLDDLKL